MVFLIIPILCKDVQGIIGLIDAAIKDYTAVSVLGTGEYLAFDQVVQISLQGSLQCKWAPAANEDPGEGD